MHTKYLIGALMAILLQLNLTAQDRTVIRKQHFNVEAGKSAIKGYDPVTYFTQAKPVKGKKELAAVYQGVVYYFSTDANRDLFKKNPAAYEPQYGGWCAYAMGETGEKVVVDPETFKLINGKLYLFYNQYFTNTLKKWNVDEARLHKNADANWNKTFKP